MYEDFFKLQARPFLPTAEVSRYFPAAAMDAAHQTLTRCIGRGEGTGLLVGPDGTGKTLLCQVLEREFQDSLAVARLSSGRLATLLRCCKQSSTNWACRIAAWTKGNCGCRCWIFWSPAATARKAYCC